VYSKSHANEYERHKQSDECFIRTDPFSKYWTEYEERQYPNDGHYEHGNVEFFRGQSLYESDEVWKVFAQKENVLGEVQEREYESQPSRYAEYLEEFFSARRHRSYSRPLFSHKFPPYAALQVVIFFLPAPLFFSLLPDLIALFFWLLDRWPVLLRLESVLSSVTPWTTHRNPLPCVN
jgi:hypothetical protein